MDHWSDRKGLPRYRSQLHRIEKTAVEGDEDRAGGIPAEYIGSSWSGPSHLGYRMTANNTGASNHSRPFSIKNVKPAIPTRDQLRDR